MTFEQLTYFLVAADTLNFSAAAKKLYIHNTTICRGIANLEKEFGAPLFLRQNNSALRLTELGIKLKEEGAALAEQYNNLIVAMQSNAKLLSGQITIIGPSVYTGLLDTSYRRFKEQYPNITYNVRDCDAGAFDAPYFAVKERKADFGITYFTYLKHNMADICTHKLGEEYLDVLIPRNHPLFDCEKIAIAELADTNVLVSDFMGEEFLAQIYERVDLSRRNRIISIEMPKDNPILLASAGYGISFIPHTLARIGEILNQRKTDEKYPMYKSMTDIDTRFDIDLIWHRKVTNPAVSRFLACLS